ncbi:54S ribosomal protein L2 mitochondrial [Cladophialophora chaetospira]|uniref:Large ribosomal subunit protein bL27m n=1 Tax=Cladophialophora chaetospira TaxID=386627 RepID=A0AA38XP75_9EURO|nr:54S ribosomal protein L2 mitochondrial [Cladophialophora chaetospira]
MLQPRIYRPVVGSEASLTALASSLNSLALCSKHAHLQPRTSTIFVRYASHAQQGRANGPSDSAGRRLGAKKGSSEWVHPGNIIFKQRGTKWFPGENVGIGKDHTLYALEYGYVRYYRDPLKHPKRRFIGIALAKEGPGSELPTPRNAPSRRRLGMFAAPMNRPTEAQKSEDESFLEAHMSAASRAPPIKSGRSVSAPTPPPAPFNRDGTFRETNTSIGLAAERKGVKVRDFDRSDRWLAWRKRQIRVKRGMEAKAARGTKKTKGKKSNKGLKTTQRKK